MSDSLDNLWKTYGIINEWIKFSDAKAGAVLALNGVIIGLIYSNLQNNPGDFTKHPIIFTSLMLGILVGCISIYFCLRCLNPTLKLGEPNSLIFFSHISQKFKKYEDYVNAANNAFNDEKNLQDDLSQQIWVNSKVAHNKYVAVTWAIRLLSLTLLIDILSSVTILTLEVLA